MRAVEHWGPVNTLLTEMAHKPGASGRAARIATRARSADHDVEHEIEHGIKRGAGLAPTAAEVRAAGGEAESVVVASGNLAMVYLNRLPGRACRAEIEAAYPGLIKALAEHSGIGVVVVADDAGPVAIGARGEHRLGADSGRDDTGLRDDTGFRDDTGLSDDTGFSGGKRLNDHTGLRADAVLGEDPLLGYGPAAAADLARHQRMDHLGDLVIISAIDPGTDDVAAFEGLVGSHGGLGGWQTEAMLLHPSTWPVTPADLAGAPALHRLLVDWRDRLADHTRIGTSRTGTSRTGTSRTGTSRTGTSRTGASRTGTSRTGTGQPTGTSQTGSSRDGSSRDGRTVAPAPRQDNDPGDQQHEHHRRENALPRLGEE